MTMRARLFCALHSSATSIRTCSVQAFRLAAHLQTVLQQQVQNNIYNAAYLQIKQQRDIPHGRYPSAVKSFDLCRQDAVLK
jgi:hypothetical protein